MFVGAKSFGNAAQKAYNSEEAQAILGAGFGAIEEAYSMSAEEAKNAMKAASGLMVAGCASMSGLLRMEIVRDFFQILGSVVNSAFEGASGVFKACAAFFGTIGNIICVNLGAAFRSEEAAVAGFALAVILVTVAIFSYLWLIFASGVMNMQGDSLRGGKEHKSFAEIAEEKKKTLYWAEKIILLCLTVYLPIGTYICQVIFCDKTSFVVQYALNKDLKATGIDDATKSATAAAAAVGIVIDVPTVTIADISCSDSPTIASMRYAGWYTFLLFLIPLPIFLAMCVKKYVPKGNVEDPDITYDADGMEVPFTDEVYADLVENDINQQLSPFRGLYHGFEKKFCLYKVGMLVWKLFLIAPTIAINAGATSQVGASVFQWIILTIQAVGFWYMSPFLDVGHDNMDASGRITASLFSLGGIFSAANAASAAKAAAAAVAAGAVVGVTVDPKAAQESIPAGGGMQFLGVLLMLANVANTCVMGYYTLMGFDSVRLKLKNISGRFTFTDSSRNQKDLSALVVLNQWNRHKEVKHRVWQAFWNGIILKKCEGEGENAGKVPQRLIKLQKDTIDHGLRAIENHWQGERNAELSESRNELRTKMEGIDMYWDDATATIDGVLDSKSNFGKLIVTAYPFEIRIAYDDCDDVTIIKSNAQLLKFVALNNSPEILAKRVIRKNLRIMSTARVMCHWPFSRWESHTVEDGFDIEEYQDADGNTHTRQKPHFSTVQVECFYTTGYINVSCHADETDGDALHARGFGLAMIYNDGHGSAIKPRTGVRFNLDGLEARMSPDHFDCDDTFTMSSGLQRLFDFGASQIATMMEPMLAKEQEYREGTLAKEASENAILGDGFWYFVYNDYKLDRPSLERYLTGQEANPILKAIPELHAAGLDFLYKRLNIIALSDAQELWYVFWEDFYHQNKDMDCMIKNDVYKFFDPTIATSVCYQPMLRDDLVFQLKQHGLYKEGDEDSFMHKHCGLFCKQLLNREIIELLYEKLDSKKVEPVVSPLQQAPDAPPAQPQV